MVVIELVDVVIVMFGDYWYWVLVEGCCVLYIMDLCIGFLLFGSFVFVSVIVGICMDVDVYIIVLMVVGEDEGWWLVCCLGLDVLFVVCVGDGLCFVGIGCFEDVDLFV